jgi:hypothetical protein
MLIIFLAFSAGLIGGTVAAGLISWWLFQYHAGRVAFGHDAIDPNLDCQINQAASRWATAHHRPAAAPLLARKLRLAYVLHYRRSRRHRRRRWWR